VSGSLELDRASERHSCDLQLWVLDGGKKKLALIWEFKINMMIIMTLFLFLTKLHS